DVAGARVSACAEPCQDPARSAGRLQDPPHRLDRMLAQAGLDEIQLHREIPPEGDVVDLGALVQGRRGSLGGLDEGFHSHENNKRGSRWTAAPPYSSW